MPAGMDWATDSANWPHRERSRFVEAGGLRWHVQQWPAPSPGAPLLLLIHGTGSSAHTWRDLAPRLATEFALLAPDLPGHGFSGAAVGDGAGMAGMASGLAELLVAMGEQPRFLVGHSAGAAIAIRMVLSQAAGPALPRGLSQPQGIVALNAALFPLRGLGGPLFSPVAKLLALNPLVPYLFSWSAGSDRVLQQLLGGTGSRIDAAGTALYRRLVTHPGHVAGALAMVSRWDLAGLAEELPQLRLPLHLVVGDNDGTVPPADSRRAQALVPGATLHALMGLGHLAHEEDAPQVAELLLRILREGAA